MRGSLNGPIVAPGDPANSQLYKLVAQVGAPTVPFKGKKLPDGAIGFHAVENRHYVTGIHATVLRQLGIDPKRLDVPGRKRLDIDYGKPIRDILS